MTTNQAPNPRDFKSWEDAFLYPVPVVRRLEQQLRSNINENSDKLRSLVGNNYRDLLGTAERIVDMDHQIHSVELRLGDIGQRCNARAVERIAANQQKTAKAQRERNHDRNALASYIALLHRCMTQAVHIIKKDDSALRAAKLLVVSRLLYTGAAKFSNPPPLLDNLKTRLTSLRRKVLNHIDRRLASVHAEQSSLVDTLAAFSLATTSTPTDVLNHFLHVRTSALSDLDDSASQSDLHNSLDLLISTIKEVQLVFPKQLSALLGKIQDEPLLKDPTIHSMSELNLDIYERWIADDVRNFTPWLRHDQLQASATTTMLKKWVTQAKSALLQGLKTLLEDTHDISDIVILRKEFISRSLSADRKLPGLDPSSFFEELRACFNHRLRDYVVSSTKGIHHIVTGYLNGEYVQSVVTPEPAADLWSSQNLEIDPGKGSINFRNLIHNSSQGKDASLQSLVQSLATWSSRLATLSSTIKTMREDRWNDDLDLDIEDDFEIDSPHDLLAREDSDVLQKLLVSEKDQTLRLVYEEVQSSAEGEGRAVRLVRLLREIGRHSSSGEVSAATSTPPPALSRTLHELLVEQVVANLQDQNKVTSKSKLFGRPPSVALWEGSPPLPVQPSPACFRYLHEACRTMKDVGSDLWSPPAVSILKARLRKSIIETLEITLSSQTYTNGSTAASGVPNGEADHSTEDPDGGSPAANGNESKGISTSSAGQNNKIVQATFDLMYLDRMLAVSSNTTSIVGFEEAINNIRNKVELDDSALERLRKSSTDYHKRTYLLFGLLAVG